ncbi:McrB family protein [Paenimyroides ceti]
MNLEIKKRIDLINNIEGVKLFFNLLNHLLDSANISSNDERLALNVRNDYRKRFSVNINSRLVLMINDNELAFMINNEDLDQITDVPVLKKESFEKQTPATLVYFIYEDVVKNLKILQSLWLKSCIDYLPQQKKSQYRIHHIEDLYNIAINGTLLEEYLNNKSEDNSLKFSQIINNLKVYLLGENNILKDFEISEVKDNSRWVWISDNQNIIGNTIAHYEIISRRNKIYTEIHFEGNQKSKDIFNQTINNLPENLEWFTWQNSKSIRFNKTFDFNEQNLTENLAISLLYLEEHIGNEIRKIMYKFSSINLLEDFLDWLIKNDGKSSNYFTKNFNSDKEKFRNELKVYETKYFDEFQTNLFSINENRVIEDIDVIKNNVNNVESKFYNYFGSLGSGGKNAILGKKHYLKFLSEYFSKNSEINQKTNYNSMKRQSLNQILYGPPGTGKTYNTINKAIAITNPDFDLNQKREIIKAEFERLVNEKQIMFTTFHQSMTYEDFIEGIKPLKPEADDEFVKYDIQNGILKTICEKAIHVEVSEDNFEKAFRELINEIEKSPSKNLILETLVHSKEFTIYKNSKGNLKFHANTEKAYEGVIRKDIIEHYLKTGEALDWASYTKAVAQYLVEKFNYNKVLKPIEHKNYVLIIDEINRGNVSQIFGELITLIEEDKRLGNDEALEVTLPYSKDKFGVPSNLYIIGTMNTADRSVEALDTALRRRFVFEEMPPKYDLEGLQQGLYGFKAAEILQTINKRIEKLLDRDHLIGHAYFIHKNETTIIDSFYKNIIPLLQEYFFGDYGKIGLVLGSGFIKVIENESVFANFEHLDYSQFEEKESYEIINHIENFEGFRDAIRILMN